MSGIHHKNIKPQKTHFLKPPSTPVPRPQGVHFSKAKQVAIAATKQPSQKSSTPPIKQVQTVNVKRNPREKKALNEQISSLTQEVKKATHTIQGLNNKLEEQKKIKEESDRVTAELYAKMQAQQALQEKYDQLSLKLAECHKTNADLVIELRNTKAADGDSNRQLSAQLDSIQSALDLLVPHLQTEITALRKQIDTQNLEIATLRGTLDVLLESAK